MRGLIVLAFCRAHVRRDFVAVARTWPEQESWALAWLEGIGKLHALNAARLEVRSNGASVIVTVRLFARAKDLAGTDYITVELPDGSTVAELRRQLTSKVPVLETLVSHSAIAVENEFAEDDQIIKPGNEIALLPPVSGG